MKTQRASGTWTMTSPRVCAGPTSKSSHALGRRPGARGSLLGRSRVGSFFVSPTSANSNGAERAPHEAAATGPSLRVRDELPPARRAEARASPSRSRREATISAPSTRALPKQWSPFAWVLTSWPIARGAGLRALHRVEHGPRQRRSKSVSTSSDDRRRRRAPHCSSPRIHRAGATRNNRTRSCSPLVYAIGSFSRFDSNARAGVRCARDAGRARTRSDDRGGAMSRRPGGDGVRVKIRSAGICGSDLHLVDTGFALGEDARPRARGHRARRHAGGDQADPALRPLRQLHQRRLQPL